MADHPTILFHVGLGKTGSTYLQKKFFPKLKGIQYISTQKYRRCKKIIEESDADRVLVSREFDTQLKDEILWFTKTFPSPEILIVLRRHDEWILSQYKRHVKNGYQGELTDFIDIQNDQGYWAKEHLYYLPMVQWIDTVTGKPPMILIYDDLYHQPKETLQALATWMKAQWSEKDYSDQKVHSSYSNHQLMILRLFTRTFFGSMPNHHPYSKLKHWLFFRPAWALFHLILNTAKLIPKKMVENEGLYSNQELDDIREYFSDDWEAILHHPNLMKVH